MSMASSCFRDFICSALTLLLFLHDALGGVRYNVVTSTGLDFSIRVAAVSSSGYHYPGDGQLKISSRASDECMKACGLGRNIEDAVTSAGLDTSVCVAAVSPSGDHYPRDGQLKISGRASDECMKACGLGQNIEGSVSSVTLLDGHLIGELCHPQCYERCPDIFHICMKLALAEGTILSGLCADDSLSRAVAPAPESQTAMTPH